MGFQKLLIIDSDHFEEAVERAVDAAVRVAIAELRKETTELKLPPGRQAGAGARQPTPPGMYRIGTGADEHSYAEVVADKIEVGEFSQEQAFRVLERWVFELSKRYKDSARRSLDNDERFERIGNRDGVWWRRRSLLTVTG